MKNSKSGNRNKNRTLSDSFLEAFRNIGNDTASEFKNNLIKKGGQDILASFFPFSKNPTQTDSIESFDQPANNLLQERQYRSHVSRLEIVRRQEKILFTREQRETQKQVIQLQEEIKKLAKSTANLVAEAKQAEISAMQEIPLAGTYHLNFLARLSKLIASLREQIHESSIWLATWNKKLKKRNYYWNQFKRSGSKFLLSSDRYVATQSG